MTPPNTPFLPYGGYRNLRSYRAAEAVYDATVVFCRRFLANDKRMTDQMVQAARSGVRNISEGSGAAATSRKSEMKLTNVARASLADELLRDYESFLMQRGLRVWPKESREAVRARERIASGGTNADGSSGAGLLAEIVSATDAEEAANTMLCAVHQAVFLLNRQLRSQGDAFVEQGGFSEQLYRQRTEHRSASTGAEAAPVCPACGKPMTKRIARQGQNAGQAFWGCSGYPECRGTRKLAVTEAV